MLALKALNVAGAILMAREPLYGSKENLLDLK